MAALTFQLQHTDSASKARSGKINTDHGEILTPIFMPVGTVGSVKAVSQQQLIEEAGVFEEAVDHRDDLDVFRVFRVAGLEAADAADVEPDLDAGL